jgi:transcriptional regulator with XRE-family HTH domain
MATTNKRKRLIKLHHRAQLLTTFGCRLQQLRKTKGISPNQFEAMSGIDAGNLAKYEQGFREPGIFIAGIMAKTLGVAPCELLDLPFDFDLPFYQNPATDTFTKSS